MNSKTPIKLDLIYLNVLKKEFEKRKFNNKKYSLRKFANDAGVDPSVLSKYLRGQRKITFEAWNLIIQRLRFDDEILNLYKKSIQEYTLLGEKHHKIKSNWIYHAILEIILLYDFIPDVDWISNRLNASKNEVKNAIELLRETGLLKISGNKFVNSIGNTSFIDDPNMDTIAGRKYQLALLDKVTKSIHSDAAELKDHTSLCIAFDTSLTLEIKKKIDNFRSEIDDFIQKNSRNYDEVYIMQINFNSITSNSDN